MTEAIEQFGALGVFLLMVPESACIPIPSEVTLLFAGFAVHAGWMSLPLAIVAATGGNLVGSLLAYGVGATGLLEGVPVAGAAIDRWGGLIDRYGRRAVLIARLLPLARTFVSLPAGTRRVPLVSFVVLTTIGCALWATGFILVGLLAGNAWTAVDGVLGRVLLGVGLVALVLTFVRAQRSA
ncbi:MAG TPA: DedA family protein [Solirubrobacteraceae bacterium]